MIHTVDLGYNEPGYNEIRFVTNRSYGREIFVWEITKFGLIRIR